MVRLLSNLADPSSLTPDDLVEGVQDARTYRAQTEGVAAAELHDRHGWTWAQVGEALGVDGSTAHRWAARYRRTTAPPVLDPDELTD